MTSAEARNFTRSRLGVPVVYSWKDQQGTSRQAGGYTRDISPAGMFLLSPACPPVGTPVVLEAFLPALSPSAANWQMETQGQVVRVEPTEGVRGFAVASERPVLRVLETSS
jgi:hypothetical protein